MEIRVSKLRELMDLLKPAVPKKPTLTVIAFIRIGEGKAVATDLETMVIADVPEAKEPLLLPFGSVVEMLKYVPGTELLKIEQSASGKSVSLTWDGGSASYPTEAVQEYPILADEQPKAEGDLDGDTLIPAMLAAVPYTAVEDSRPVLKCVCLTLGNPIEVAGGDGFRISYQVLGLSFPFEGKILVPAQSVDILGHVFNKTPRTPPSDATSLIPVLTAKRQLHVALVGDKKVRIGFGAATVVVNLTEGSYPDYRQLVPQGEPILQSQIFALQLEAAVKRVRDIAKDGSGIVRLVFADGKVTVSAHSDETTLSASMATLNTQGEPGRVAMNYKYLLEYLAGKQGVIQMTQCTKNGPVVFEYQKSPKVLIMPMQNVVWGDEKPAENAEPVAEAKTEPAATTQEDPPATSEEPGEEEENSEQESGSEEPAEEEKAETKT